MKSTKIIYWISTGLIVLFDSVMTALSFNTQLAIEGIHHLGYPDYFRIQLTVFKVVGGILLILPAVSPRWKEWAYAGLTFSILSACVAHGVVDGWQNPQTYFPLVILAILWVSYQAWHKMKAAPRSYTQVASA